MHNPRLCVIKHISLYTVLVMTIPRPIASNNNIPALVEIMAWRQTGDKPLSEPMMVKFTYLRHSASMS